MTLFCCVLKVTGRTFQLDMNRHKPIKHKQKEDILSSFSSVYKGMD